VDACWGGGVEIVGTVSGEHQDASFLKPWGRGLDVLVASSFESRRKSTGYEQKLRDGHISIVIVAVLES
jgi:hypothetical protein